MAVVYLVIDCVNTPGMVFAVFDDLDAAIDFKEHYHPDDAEIETRTLLYGQQLSGSGYIP